MPDLPHSRVAPFPPFTFVGLDNFGPLFVRDDEAWPEKRWVSLFTCLTTRAVHLEMVQTQSAEHFVSALRRLIAVRGLPKTVVCDNASQFKCLAEVFKDQRIKSVKFDFIPAFAPWQGGVYERMVQSVKSVLRKTLGKAKVSSDQLQTILCEAAAIVNSRPLVYVGESATVLTPASFLQLNPRTTLVDENLHQIKADACKGTSTRANLISSWRKGQQLLEHYWRLFVDEYVTSLRERNRLQHKQSRDRKSTPRVPREGEVVLIHDEKLPRLLWKVGRIESVTKSKDGAIRSATVRQANAKVITRPVNLLHPLELE
jgi:hypothetical protein